MFKTDATKKSYRLNLKNYSCTFYQEKNLNNIRDIFLYQKIHKIVGEVKYLVRTLDKNLTYKPNVENITNRAIKDLWVCR